MSRLLRSMLSGRYMNAAGSEGSDTGGTGGGDTAVIDREEEELDENSDTSGVLEMSDDEIMKMSAPPVPKTAATDKPTIGDGDPDVGGGETAGLAATGGDKTTITDPDDTDLDPDNPDAGGDGKATKDVKDPKAAATDKPAATAGEAGKGGEEGAAGADDKSKTAGKEGAEGTAETTPPDDAAIKAFYAKITAPFKANGREIKVDSAEDAIQLMQMGANYNKRMAALKPHLRLVRMLENNGLNEEQLSFLIDVSKKDKAAISKLVKESGIDPMDLSSDNASEYKPGSHAVSDTEVELDSVLEEIKSTSPQAYTQTLEVVTSKWDAVSKQVIAASPQVLKVIAAHMDAGIYDLITKEVENERLFGRLSGLSDIEAYRKVGDDMNAKGRFNQVTQGSSQGGGQPDPSKKVVVVPPKKDDDKDRNDKRRAASPGRTAPASSTRPADFNPLNMSDEEIEKMGSPKFL